MQQMLQNFDDEKEWKVPKEEDPFEHDPSLDVYIGCCRAPLCALVKAPGSADQQEDPVIDDYRGIDMGRASFTLKQCDAKEAALDADAICEPEALVGKELHYVFQLKGALELPERFTDVYARFVMYGETEYTCTGKVKVTENPVWNFKKQGSLTNITAEMVDQLKSGYFFVQFWAKQKVVPPGKAKKKQDPKKEDKKEQKKEEKMEMKSNMSCEEKMRFLCRFMELTQMKGRKVPTKRLKSLVYAPDTDEAQKCIKWAEDRRGAGESGSSSSSSSSDSSDSDGEGQKKKKQDKKDKKEDEGKKEKKDKDKESSTCVLL